MVLLTVLSPLIPGPGLPIALCLWILTWSLGSSGGLVALRLALRGCSDKRLRGLALVVGLALVLGLALVAGLALVLGLALAFRGQLALLGPEVVV